MKNTHFSIKIETVHLWRVVISDFFPKIDSLTQLLSNDEIARRDRFKFKIHQDRFVVTRSILRQVLGLYTFFSPEQIQFGYGEHGKPFLKENGIYFNVSHSDDLAVFAIANESIGVDIEERKSHVNEAIAKRFFTEEEFETLSSLAGDLKIKKFYDIWSGKEAVIKLFGEGVFSSEQAKESTPYVEHVFVHPDYAMAFATLQKIQYREFYEWTANGFQKVNDFTC